MFVAKTKSLQSFQVVHDKFSSHLYTLMSRYVLIFFPPIALVSLSPWPASGCGFRAGSGLPIFRHAHTIKRHGDIKHTHYGHWSQTCQKPFGIKIWLSQNLTNLINPQMFPSKATYTVSLGVCQVHVWTNSIGPWWKHPQEGLDFGGDSAGLDSTGGWVCCQGHCLKKRHWWVGWVKVYGVWETAILTGT